MASSVTYTSHDDSVAAYYEHQAYLRSKEAEGFMLATNNASPKGVYATLTALQTAYPTGTTGIYLVTADGKWYYWNGSAWTAGGTYQATGIADGSVTPAKTTFFSFSKNLFNPNDADFLSGKGFSGTTNTIVTTSLYNITGYITAVAGDKILISNNGVEISNPTYCKIASYKTDGTWISTQAYTTGGVTLASETAKIRVQADATNTKLQIEKTQVTTYSAYHEPRISDINKPVVNFSELVGTIKKEQTPFFVVGRNKFNASDPDILLGQRYNTSGALVTDATLNQSGLIPVVAGTNYTATYTGAYVLWYNSNKTLIGNTPSTTFYSQGYVTAIANASYARFCGQVANWNVFQVEEGTAQTEYEAYKLVFDSELLSIHNPLKTKTWVSFGDSITFRNKWQPYLVNLFGLNHINCGIGSTKLGGNSYTSGGTTYYSMWEDVRINAVKATNPDFLTIQGGTNDIGLGTPLGTSAEYTKLLANKDKTTFRGAYSYIIENLLTWKPSLQIVLITTPWGNNAYSNPSYEDFANATIDVGKHYGLPVVDIYHEMGLNALTASVLLEDTVHPSTVGYKRIANLVIDRFNKLS